MLTLHTASLVLTADAAALPDGAVAVDGDRIAALGPYRRLAAAYPGARTRRWPGLITPGLRQRHAVRLLTGTYHPDPREAAELGDQPIGGERLAALGMTDARWGASARRGLQRMLRYGTTAVAGGTIHCPAVRVAVARSGMAVVVDEAAEDCPVPGSAATTPGCAARAPVRAAGASLGPRASVGADVSAGPASSAGANTSPDPAASIGAIASLGPQAFRDVQASGPQAFPGPQAPFSADPVASPDPPVSTTPDRRGSNASPHPQASPDPLAAAEPGVLLDPLAAAGALADAVPGPLSVGARADLAVFAVSDEAALMAAGAVSCLATVLAGRLVYRRA